MLNYIIRRLLMMVPTLLLVSIICFLSVRFIPASVVDIMVAEMGSDLAVSHEQAKEQVTEALGLDVPVHVQYGRWLGKAIQGNLGNSLWTGTSIVDDISERVPVSAELGIIAIVTALMIAIPVGVLSAIRQDSGFDYLGRTVSIIFISLPVFWIGTIVVVYPSIWWGWTPSMEYIPFTQNPGGNILQFLLPGAILGMYMSGVAMRMTRTMLLDVLRQDYIRTAWAKGLTERVIIIRHALKNSLIPVITIIGIQLGIIVGGSVVLEQIFVLPGIGRLLLEALTKRDYPMISGINLLVCGFVLVVNLLVDIMYGYLDPRIKFR